MTDIICNPYLLMGACVLNVSMSEKACHWGAEVTRTKVHPVTGAAWHVLLPLPLMQLTGPTEVPFQVP